MVLQSVVVFFIFLVKIPPAEPFSTKILAHQTCRRNFTDIKRLLLQADTPGTAAAPIKRLRSTLEPFHWKENYFLCAEDAAIDERHSRDEEAKFIALRQ